MTSTPAEQDLPDFRHAWVWGCTAAGLLDLRGGSTGIAALIAGLLLLVPAAASRRHVVLGLGAGGLLVWGVVPLLFARTLAYTGPEATGDALILAILIIGFLSGVVSGGSGWVVTMPGFRAFRLIFLELCVLTGLFGGLLLLPSLHFERAADSGGRITFAAALILLFLLVPATLGHLVGRLGRQAVLNRRS